MQALPCQEVQRLIQITLLIAIGLRTIKAQAIGGPTAAQVVWIQTKDAQTAVMEMEVFLMIKYFYLNTRAIRPSG